MDSLKELKKKFNVINGSVAVALLLCVVFIVISSLDNQDVTRKVTLENVLNELFKTYLIYIVLIVGQIGVVILANFAKISKYVRAYIRLTTLMYVLIAGYTFANMLFWYIASIMAPSYNKPSVFIFLFELIIVGVVIPVGIYNYTFLKRAKALQSATPAA